MFGSEITLKHTAHLIAKCWTTAEDATRTLIAQKYNHPSEENITFLFTGELKKTVEDSSHKRSFEKAFLKDLQDNLRTSVDLRRFARGLIARVNFHNRRHEGYRSAADFGIVITRPRVRRRDAGSFRIDPVSAQALLVQAKLGKTTDEHRDRFKWGTLTKAQEALIPKHLSYYALVLYRLNGNDGNTLMPFRWQLCRQHSVEEIKRWLRQDSFPQEMESSAVIRKLATGYIGTRSKRVIEFFVDPSGTQPNSIEICISWPEGQGPPERPLHLFQKRSEKTRIFVRA